MKRRTKTSFLCQGLTWTNQPNISIYTRSARLQSGESISLFLLLPGRLFCWLAVVIGDYFDYQNVVMNSLQQLQLDDGL